MEGTDMRQVRSLARVLLASLALVLIAPAAPAWAHGEGETTVGYELVQQAIGHLAHDGGHAAMDAAMEKVNDALKAADQHGMDVTLVEQAKAALEAEDVTRARTLLQQSITATVTSLPPATGEQTGTHQVLLPLRGRGALNGSDWTLLGLSVLVLLAGVVLTYLLRPADRVRDLRAGLRATGEATP